MASHYSKWSSNPASGSPPSYQTFPSNNGTPSNRPCDGLPPYTHRYATPTPTPTRPPTFIPHRREEYYRHEETRVVIGCGPIICIAIILVQAVLIICHSDALAKFIDLESAALRASKERERLELEREKMRRERELWERAREDRVPQGAYWEAIWPAPECRAYGKREYWGTLQNVPAGWTAIDACMNMPVEIKGVTVRRPDRCAFVEGSPHIHGYWMVDWDQPDCKPWYRNFHDTGCTSRGSGTRRIEAQIVGIINKKEQDWRVMCESTPLVWNHITYTSPTHCQERRYGRKVAMWDIPDNGCR